MKAHKIAFQPAKGSSIKVDPIRDVAAIARIKGNLADRKRDLCLFTLGINTAYRGGELVSVRVGQVLGLRPGDPLDLKQSKTQTYRTTTLNRTVIAAVEDWLMDHPCPEPEAPLFISRYRRDAIGVSSLNHLVKKWCLDAGLVGNFGSHSLRKTWGYHQRMKMQRPVALLMTAFGHSSEGQTLAYLGIQPDEIRELYDMEL